jgi:tetratricopeptide (TPR) repeat protein
MDWSYELLSEEDRELFGELSVFVGGFYLEQAEAICDVPDVLEGVFSLKEHSLLQVEEVRGQMRYRMLEMVRTYAGEKLGSEGGEIRGRHAAYFAELVGEWSSKVHTSDAKAALEAIALELGNVRGGMDWSLEVGEDGWVGAFGLALKEFFEIRGLWEEGRRRLLEAEEALGRSGDEWGMVRVLHKRASYYWRQGDYAEAWQIYEKGLEIAQSVGDHGGAALCLQGLGNISTYRGNYPEAQRLFTESLDIRRDLNDLSGMASVLNNLGNIAIVQGDYAEAQRLHTQSLKIRTDLGDRRVIAVSLGNLGAIASLQGRYAEARSLATKSLEIHRDLDNRDGMALCLENLGSIAVKEEDFARASKWLNESLQIAKELGDRRIMAAALSELGNVAFFEHDPPKAHRLLRESLELSHQVGLKPLIAECLHRLGQLAQVQGNAELAVGLLTAAIRLYEELSRPEVQQVQTHLDSLRETLGEQAFSGLQTQAEQESTEDIILLALQSEQ